MKITSLRTEFLTTVGTLGGVIASAFGGWDASMTTLMLFMAIDYITGLIVAGVFHKSTKSESGSLESRAGWKGLCRKGTTLLIVLVAYRLDIAMSTTVIRDGVIIAFIANEAISIMENAGLMGLPVPKIIMNSIEVLKKRVEEE